MHRFCTSHLSRVESELQPTNDRSRDHNYSTHLRIILKQGKSSTWRGTYAHSDAFDKCEHFDKPTWLRVLPIDANDLWREDF